MASYVLTLSLIASLCIGQGRSLKPPRLKEQFRPPRSIPLGVVLEGGRHGNVEIFEVAAESFVENNRARLDGSEFNVMVPEAVKFNPYWSLTQACSHIGRGSPVLISSTSCETSIAIQYMTDKLRVPHLMIPKDQCQVMPDVNFTLSMKPEWQHMDLSVIDIVKHMRIRHVVILSDDDHMNGLRVGLYREKLAGVNIYVHPLQLHEQARGSDYTRDDSPDDGFHYVDNSKLKSENGNLKSALGVQLSELKGQKEHAFVLISNPETCMHVLKQALQEDMLSAAYKWIIASSDFDNSAFDDLKDAFASMVLINRPAYTRPARKKFENLPPVLQVGEGDFHDAVLVASSAITNCLNDLHWQQITKLNCSKNLYWKSGSTLMRELRNGVDRGVTGRVSFSGTHRTDLALTVNIFDTSNTLWRKAGTWDPVNGLNLTIKLKASTGLPKTVLNIVTVLEEPFMMYEQQANGDNYTGFCMELIRSMSRTLNFDYKVYHVAEYGKQNETGQWIGAVGEVANKRAHMAISGMLVTSKREEVVDFSTRFMDYGVGIIMKETYDVKSPFGFLEPLDTKVWIAVLASIFIVSSILFIITRISPYTKLDMGEDRTEFEDFTILNSLWFSIASIMQQGCDHHLQAHSTRILGTFWWLFTLIIISTYTANLAAFLTVNRMENPISSLQDLSSQNIKKYGTVRGSPIHLDFKEQKELHSLYDRIKNYLEDLKNNEVLVDTAIEGYKKVLEDDYAFMWDDAIHQYMKTKDCSYVTVGKPFLLKGYGIAIQKGAPYIENISWAILKLQESGELKVTENKWFESKRNCSLEEEKQSTDVNAKGIEMAKVAGMFYVLIGGNVLAFLTAVSEVCWYRNEHRRPGKNSGSDEYEWQQLRWSSSTGRELSSRGQSQPFYNTRWVNSEKVPLTKQSATMPINPVRTVQSRGLVSECPVDRPSHSIHWPENVRQFVEKEATV